MTLTRRELFEFGTFLWSLLKKCVVRTEKTMKNDKSHKTHNSSTSCHLIDYLFQQHSSSSQQTAASSQPAASAAALAHRAAMEADAAAPDLPAGPWAGHFANPYAFEVGDLVWIGDDRPVAAAFHIPPDKLLHQHLQGHWKKGSRTKNFVYTYFVTFFLAFRFAGTLAGTLAYCDTRDYVTHSSHNTDIILKNRTCLQIVFS